MADVKLSNIADVTGNYDSIPTTLTSEAVITDLISGLTIKYQSVLIARESTTLIFIVFSFRPNISG